MAAARHLLVRHRNAASNSTRLFSSSAALIQRPRVQFSDDSGGESAVYKKTLKLQRPSTVRYMDCLPNSVSLIGLIERPFKVVNSTNLGVHTHIRVNAPTGGPYLSFSVMLKFWDKMAEMSVQHLKLNDLVYVSGRLDSFRKMDENGKCICCYEVNVREVNFVSRNSLGPAYQNIVNMKPEVSPEEIIQKRRDRIHLWQIFFASPYEWWDNRNCKKHPNAPDFKHKDTGEALWLQDSDPPWIRKQLQLQDSRLYRRNSGEHKNAWSHLSPLVYDE